jgi:hypothetical protein
VDVTFARTLNVSFVGSGDFNENAVKSVPVDPPPNTFSGASANPKELDEKNVKSATPDLGMSGPSKSRLEDRKLLREAVRHSLSDQSAVAGTSGLSAFRDHLQAKVLFIMHFGTNSF